MKKYEADGCVYEIENITGKYVARAFRGKQCIHIGAEFDTEQECIDDILNLRPYATEVE